MAALLIGKVEDSGGTAARSSNGARLEVIAGYRRGQGQFHMRMHIYGTRKDVFPLRANDGIVLRRSKDAGRAQRGYPFVFDQDIAHVVIGCRYNMPVCDKRSHMYLLALSLRTYRNHYQV